MAPARKRARPAGPGSGRSTSAPIPWPARARRLWLAVMIAAAWLTAVAVVSGQPLEALDRQWPLALLAVAVVLTWPTRRDRVRSGARSKIHYEAISGDTGDGGSYLP